jgi:hypothetical protein
MTLGKFILGIIIAAIGFLITWKSEWLLNNFGRISFAEKHLHSEGGSRLMYKLIGILVIIIGLLYATDLTDNLIAIVVNTVFNTQIKVE